MRVVGTLQWRYLHLHIFIAASYAKSPFPSLGKSRRPTVPFLKVDMMSDTSVGFDKASTRLFCGKHDIVLGCEAFSKRMVLDRNNSLAQIYSNISGLYLRISEGLSGGNHLYKRIEMSTISY